MQCEASTVSIIFTFTVFTLITFDEYPKSDLPKPKTPQTQQNVCK